MKNISPRQSRVLVAGSIAYDQLLHYHGKFHDIILPSSLHALSVSFGVTEKASFLGGCGGNIARHLKKLGAEPILVGFAGNDFDRYETKLNQEKISTRYLLRTLEKSTAKATIVTDDESHQLAFFNFGAQDTFRRKEIKILEKYLKRESPAFAILSPTNPNLITLLALWCQKRSVPYFFDPGQAMPQFTSDNLKRLVQGAFGLFVNQYEMTQICNYLKTTTQKLYGFCPLVVETLGEKGSLVAFQGKTSKVPAYPVKKRSDPTGAGDAYRAGFLHTLLSTGRSAGEFRTIDMKRAGIAGSKFASRFLSRRI